MIEMAVKKFNDHSFFLKEFVNANRVGVLAIAGILGLAVPATANAVMSVAINSAQLNSYEQPVGVVGVTGFNLPGPTYTQSGVGAFSYSAEALGYFGPLSFDTASASVNTNRNLIILASTSIQDVGGDLGSGDEADAGASYFYYVEILGPAAQNIPVDVFWSGSATLTDPGAEGNVRESAQIGVSAYLPPAPYDVPTAFNALDFLGTRTFSGVRTFSATNDIPFVVSGSVYSDVQGYVGSGSISLDPVVAIDPAFSTVDPNYLNDYTIVESAGIGNSPAGVPEPTAWEIMIFGIGAMGAALRRRPKVGGEIWELRWRGREPGVTVTL